MKRGEIWWADLPDPVASEPGYRRPLVIIDALANSICHPRMLLSGIYDFNRL
jgi:mRNA-degrading endonuclease toxin of MazEF toxin-antitoxin module